MESDEKPVRGMCSRVLRVGTAGHPALLEQPYPQRWASSVGILSQL